MTPRLAMDGARPLHDGTWPTWPPPADEAQRRLVLQALDSGRWGATSGDLGATFARRFAQRHDCPDGVCTVNGTIGLTAALVALGVRPGDEVVVPSYTFVASATAVLMMGAVPVLADVDPSDGHLTAATLTPALSPATKAVMVVHLAGSPCAMDPILALTVPRGIPVLEDAAQAHGASYRGRPAGSLGDVGSFSFQASKAMTAGEGGVLTASDPALVERLWSICNVGRTRGGAWYGHEMIGWNLRMTEFQAAILLPWLDRLDDEIDRRNAFVDAFAGRLDADGAARMVPPPEGTTRDTRHLGMVDLDPERRGLAKAWVLAALEAEGVPLEAGYPGLARIPAVAAASRCLPTPGTDEFGGAVAWLRQPMLMADEALAEVCAEAVTRVLSDPRSWRQK